MNSLQSLIHPLRTGLTILTLVLCGDARVGALTVPPADEILKTLASDHPRLYASGAEFEELKHRLNSEPELAAWTTRLLSEAEKLLTAPTSRYEIPDGLRLLATSRRVVSRVQTLAMAYRLTGEVRFSQRAWQELAAAAAFPDWNPKHFLDTAEMTYAFAIGYDWLYDVWDHQQRDTLQRAIVQKGLLPAREIYRDRKSWTRARHNWNQVCNGGIGVGALAIGDADRELCSEILKGALESLPLAMSEFAPDGAWNEGPGYWAYATRYNVAILAALRSALGTDFGLSQIPGFSLTGLFPLYIAGPLGRTFNYADGGDGPIRGSQFFWLSKSFSQPVLAWHQRQSKSPDALDLLWFRPDGGSPSQSGLPLDRYFRQAEVVTMRSAWDSREASFVGFKAGDNKANHSHLDVGSFVFDANGVRWATDLGADNYNLPGYFGSERWKYYRLRAEGQNTLVINPGLEPDQDPKGAASITRFQTTPAKAFAIADLSPVYRKSASSVVRGVALIDRRDLLVQDEIQADKPAAVWWFMHTTAVPKISGNTRTIILSQGEATLTARIVAPESAQWVVMDATPLPDAPHPPNQATNEGFKKLAIHLENVTGTTLTVLLAPSGGTRIDPQAHLKPLSNW